ncbi:hypothetical protein EPUS_06890 [Endocarpon pusillum Z07020]|uniref:protein-ribulosamine 3-kinase n=1 Tax=Endocarpon pusillum (strain Z07020 / HMAS-L-300199) TaxID=1263415 RepID=U1GH59_ENDPU|nr:uncharacterized protein EPUS_06890 [Endocarpon pusillum Z07020]ERF77022.1 hypothetical protein EPUS_06890 [Endocarpon pusillum Z07020]
MPPPVDPAILRALSLDPSTTKIASHGGSGFSSTFRLATTTKPLKSFFVKTSPSPDAALMFEGEHASLNAIHSAVPSLGPQSFAWGKLDSQPNSYFLATEFIDLSSRRRSTSKTGGGSGMTLAQKLAKLHTTPAPIPSNYNTPQCGFPVPTCCGDTPQPNQPYTTSWPDFFAKNRLLFILERGEGRNGKDPELRSLVEKTASKVVPRLLGEGHLGGPEGIAPVVVHGDLWSGNHSRGTFPGRQAQASPDTNGADGEVEAGIEDIIYDPSSTYAHSEYELGIMKMFGGFGSGFYREYHDLVPKTEPVGEYDDRVALYECYHHLNHWAIFGGGGYRNGAVTILKRLVKKYAGDG